MPHYRKIYEQYHGLKIPKGYHIHHKDMNHGNDDPLNLEMLTPDEHAQKHGFLNNFLMAQSTAQERATIAKRTPEYRAKMSAIVTGTKKGNYSLEHCYKMSIALKGKVRSKESVNNMRRASVLYWSNPDNRAKLSASMKGQPGRKHTEESKAKMSKLAMGRKISAETRTKISNTKRKNHAILQRQHP